MMNTCDIQLNDNEHKIFQEFEGALELVILSVEIQTVDTIG